MTRSRLILYTFVFAIIALGDLLWWRLADRRLQKLRHARLCRGLLAGWMGWMAVYLVLACFLPSLIRRSDSPIPVPVHAAVYLWHLFVLPILLAGELLEGIGLGAAAVVALVWRWRNDRGRSSTPASFPDSLAPSVVAAPLLPSRRQLLGGAAMALPPLMTAGLVGRAMAQLNSPPRVRRMDLVLPQLPLHLDGVTIAHVTDIHVGKFTHPGMLSALAEQVNNLRADFVAVTGDLIDVCLSDLPQAIDMLNRIDPRHGMVVCEGNHDLFESRHRFERRTKAAGLPLLLDEASTIDFRGYPIQFLGARWDESDDHSIERSFATLQPLIQPEAFPILLAHHPHAFDCAAAAGVPLTLSGHTHGGQLMLTDQIGGGSLFFRYWSGLYRKNNCALVVSNGVGAWFPLRINAPAEIIHLTLHAAV